MAAARDFTVLHYTGSDDDRGGIMSVVRALAGAERFACVLGVNAGFAQRRTPPLPTVEFSCVAAETIGVGPLWRARAVARQAAAWLAQDETRIFHAHSRAGMLVALWLVRAGQRRVVASVHCYGRQRWFYRWSARQLGDRLYWLSPAMKRHYGILGEGWAQCIPGCVPTRLAAAEGREPRARLPGAPLRLGGVGALVRWKGWHLVLDALARLPAPPPVRFEHIGAADTEEDRQYLAEMRGFVTARGLDGAVAWHGQQASSAEFLRTLDCLVIGSDREPFSVAMIEALAAGVPVLAADSGGATDVIVPGRNGWLFASGRADDLRLKIAQLAQGDAVSGMRIRSEDVLPYTAPVVAGQWRQVYARVSGATESNAARSTAR